MYASHNIAAHAALRKEAEEKTALSPETLRMLMHGGVGAGLAAIPTYALTRAHDEKERHKAQTRSFGAGLATGVAAPNIVHGLLNIARAGAPGGM